MAMTKYITDELAAKELALIERVVPLWGMIAEKNPELHKIDFSLAIEKDDSIMGFVEAKCRNCNHDKYRTFFISLAKYIHACELTKFTGIPTFILVEWMDQTKYVKVPCMTADIRMGGRIDRGNPDDHEPMIHIPITEFRPVEEVPDLFPCVRNDLDSLSDVDWDDSF